MGIFDIFKKKTPPPPKVVRTLEELEKFVMGEPEPFLLKVAEPTEKPLFKFFPNLMTSKSVEESSEPCQCCGKVEKYSYIGGMFCEEEVNNLCLNCIANGDAAKKFNGEFYDRSAIANRTTDKEVTDEIMYRTPTYVSWQDPEWLSHCKHPCIYVGQVYIGDLFKLGIYKQVRTELSKACYYKGMEMTVAEIDDMLVDMVKDSELEGHLFHCVVYGKYKLHVDLS